MTDLRTLLSRQISVLCVHEHAHAADRLSELYDDDKACKSIMGSKAPATLLCTLSSLVLFLYLHVMPWC